MRRQVIYWDRGRLARNEREARTMFEQTEPERENENESRRAKGIDGPAPELTACGRSPK